MKNIFFNVNEDLKGLKATEVVSKMGLDYDIQQMPVYCNNKRIPNTLANIRMDTEEVLGIVTERYTPINNMDSFEWVNELVGDINIINAGELKGGKQTYLLADLQERYISSLDAEIECKLAFITNHDGMGAIKVNILPMVDGKILTLPIKYTRRSFKAVHQKSIRDKMANAQNTLDTAKSYMEAILKETVRLSSITFSDLQKDIFVGQVFPMDAGLSEAGYKHCEERREELLKYINGNTAFDFIMGVSTFINESTPQRKTKTGEVNRFAETIQNHPLIDRAYKIIDSYKA